jgi:hypothetical protein
MDDVKYDIVIVGGSLGGVAAALRAGAMGSSVCLLEATTWLGGQFTAQGVNKPDENQYIETVGSTAAYRDFRHAVRAYYRANYKLSPGGSGQPSFNPGGSYPGFATEPLLGHKILLQQLEADANVHVRLQLQVTQAETSGDAVTALIATDASGNTTRFTASMFLDATDLGDLLPVAGVEFTLGAESQAQTGEALAPAAANPAWIQPITVPIALERRPTGENHTIARPANYAQLKAQQNYSIVDGYINSMFNPGSDLWSYRRYIAAANFADPAFPNDLSMLNMAANDLQQETLPTGSAAGDAAVVEAARQVTLGYLYWLQTECPRNDGSGNTGFPELMPRPDAFGTSDGTAAQPYVRESRRINALALVKQQDIDADSNPGPRAAFWNDSCGIGYYGGMDVHALASVGMPECFASIKPFQIPVSALIPARVTNVLAACKNLGVSHLANGAYRLHPCEWNIGESAGALAAFALQQGVNPRDVPASDNLLRSYQQTLLDAGVPLYWWSDVDPASSQWAAIQMLGARGLASGEGDLAFHPGDPLTDDAKAALATNLGQNIDWPSSSDMTRGAAALWLVGQLA